jgi:CBS domain-containing protein/sporulation protein YlmC with PRC-barrel domain
VLALSDYLRQPVLDARGGRVGRLRDLAVRLDEREPAVVALMVDGGRLVGWERVAAFERSEVTLAGDEPPSEAEEGLLWLVRDVLDSQVVDVEGKRLARVGDVELARDGRSLRVVAVDVGLSAVVRRLGPRWLARRLSRDALAWDEIHLASGRGHELQLSSPAAAVHRLGPEELAQLVGRLPVGPGADVLRTVPRPHAAGALGASRRAVAAGLVRELGTSDAPAVLAHMPVDDTAAVLRAMGEPEREELLEQLGPEEGGRVRRLLRYRSGTAGAVMTPDVRTARPDEPLGAVRERLARDPPALDGLLSVVVVDPDGRPTGVLPATAVLAGRGSPVAVPAVNASAPLDEVIERFATYDVLCVPVVDEQGRLAGAVAVDDLLDVLLAERLPGGPRYDVMSVRRRAPT